MIGAIVYAVLTVGGILLLWLNPWCMGGHDLQIRAPLLNQCKKCRRWWYTNYFESRATGRMVRDQITEAEAHSIIERHKRGSFQ